MAFSANRTVRELAVEIPNAARIFEKYRIDYCCGGSRSLEDACTTAGVDAGEIIRLLEEPAKSEQPVDSTDFRSMPAAELINHIVVKHHTFTRNETERITNLMEKVCSVHGANHPELLKLQEMFGVLADDLAPHMMKEENILFPYIMRMEQAATRNLQPPRAPFGSVSNPVRVMMTEHDTAGDLLQIMRHATNDYTLPDDACFSFRTLYQALEEFERDLHQHIHLENNILFPLAEEMESYEFQA